MATAQLPLQSGTWTDLFPENQVTELQSTVFVKKLLAIAVSNISYMRVVFPERAFGDRRLENLNLKILKNDKSCPSAAQIVDWLKGAFDALDKKYLRMLIFGIYRSSSDPNTLLEMYTFRFTYTDTTEMEVYSNDKKISSATSASQTKKATILLLRNLIELVQTLKPLPDDVQVTMKLFYYENVTPGDYEPPGFRAADTDDICIEGNPTKHRFNKVSTAFHSVQLRVIAGSSTATEDELTSVMDEQQMTVTGLEGLDVEIGDALTQQEQIVDSTTPQTDLEARGESAERFSQSHPAAAMGDDVAKAGDMEPVMGVRCACKANEDDGLMISCSVCHYWQHAICFKVLDESSAPEHHVCNLCCTSVDAAFEPTDPELSELPEAEVQMICLWRRSLAILLKLNQINTTQLASRLGTDNNIATKLIKRLASEGYITFKGKNASGAKYVQKRKIKREALSKYFARHAAMEVD